MMLRLRDRVMRLEADLRARASGGVDVVLIPDGVDPDAFQRDYRPERPAAHRVFVEFVTPDPHRFGDPSIAV